MTVSNELERTWKNVVVGSVIGSPVSNSKANNTKVKSLVSVVKK